MVRKLFTAALLAALVHVFAPPLASAAAELCLVDKSEFGEGGELKIRGGVEPQRVWLVADYNGLQIRKFTAKNGAAVLEFRRDDDTVVLSVARSGQTVSRNGTTVALGTPESVEAVRELLDSSPAMFHTRLLLSRYENTSDLKGPSLSLLSGAAIAAALTGDVEAPYRLVERFLEKHRGLLRRVAAPDSCWDAYEKNVNEAANDYEACLVDASNAKWYLQYSMAQACSFVWVLEAEAAWFEMLKCSGATSLMKVE